MSIKRITKKIILDETVGVIEESLGIAIPSGQVIRLINVQFMVNAESNSQVLAAECFGTMLAKPSNMPLYKSEDMAVAPEVIAVGNLRKEGVSGTVTLVPETFLNVAPEPFALDLWVGAGFNLASDFTGKQLVVAVVDYELVKLTSAIASNLAAR